MFSVRSQKNETKNDTDSSQKSKQNIVTYKSGQTCHAAAPLKHCLPIMAKASERCRRGESSKEQFLFIPFNLSNRHWTLLFVNLKTKTLHILDLLKQHTDADLANKVSIITNIILDKIFGYSKGLKVWRIFHKMMFFSCGKLSCYYASHILLNLQWFVLLV